MTDTDALKERLFDALQEARWVDSYDITSVVLPIVAAEARKAKAEAWDECVDEAAACGWTTGYASRDIRDRNPYRETGASDEHR